MEVGHNGQTSFAHFQSSRHVPVKPVWKGQGI